MRAVKRTIRGIAGLAVLAGSFQLAQTPAAAAAGSLDLCRSTSYSCLSETGYTTQNTWSQQAGHNCTRYVAHRLARNGMSRPYSPMGDAGAWDSNAQLHGFTVNKTPVEGSIAQWENSIGGHVAYVEVVAHEFIEITEDSTTGTSSRRRLYRSASEFKAADFIHFRDFPRAAASPGGLDFNGDDRDDIFWYGPGSPKDVLWSGTATRGVFSDKAVNVGGVYTPIGGDFNGDGRDDIFWYRPGASSDALWSGTTSIGSFSSTSVNVGGVYTPIAGDFNGDGRDDIFWYRPGASSDSLWSGTTTKGNFTPTSMNVGGYYSPVG